MNVCVYLHEILSGIENRYRRLMAMYNNFIEESKTPKFVVVLLAKYCLITYNSQFSTKFEQWG